jgi:hypothetical protein
LRFSWDVTSFPRRPGAAVRRQKTAGNRSTLAVCRQRFVRPSRLTRAYVAHRWRPSIRSRVISKGNHETFGLHFEHVKCSNRAAVCTAAGCLHQVYISTGKYRLLKSSYVPELDLTEIKILPQR